MLQKEQQKVAILQEQLISQKQDTDERIRRLEALMIQKFADHFS